MNVRQPYPYLVLVGIVLGAVIAGTWPITFPAGGGPVPILVYGAKLCGASAVGILALLTLHRVRAEVLRAGAPFSPVWGNRRLLLISAMPALVFFLGLLGAWPGHLTSDSVGHWIYASRGVLEPLSASYTLLVAVLAKVWPSPATVIMFQIACFSCVTFLAARTMLSLEVPSWIVVGFVLLLCFWPANLFMVISLWKDVPYNLALWGLALVVLLLVRAAESDGLTADRKLIIGYAFLLITVMLMRVNGLLTGVLIAAMLPVVLWRRKLALRIAGAGGAAVVLVVAVRMIVLPQVTFAYPTFVNAWHAWHVIGSYVDAGTSLDRQDVRLLEEVVPLERIRSLHDCVDVGRVVHVQPFNYEAQGRSVTEINRLALRLILADPLVFLRHQLCLTAPIWRISGTPERPLYLPHYRSEEIDPSVLKEFGIQPAPIVPAITHVLHEVRTFSASEGWQGLFWRPAWCLYATLAVAAYLAVTTRRPRYLALALVPLAHSAVLAASILSPDYRYQHGVVLIAFSTLPLLFARLPNAEQR